jgi:hypothetical protein
MVSSAVEPVTKLEPGRLDHPHWSQAVEKRVPLEFTLHGVDGKRRGCSTVVFG